MATDFVIIRHGEPAAAGVEDPPLSDRGRREAEATAMALAGADFAALYVSPMLRARQSAEPLARVTGLEPIVEERVSEFNSGQAYYSEKHAAEMSGEQALAILAAMQDPAFLNRVRTGFDDIAAAHPDATVAVVCHGGVISAMMTAAIYNDALILLPDNGSVTRIRSQGGGFRSLVSFNETSWLAGIE